MNNFHRFLTVCAALLLIVPVAAATDWSDNFDSYALDSSIDGQGGWAGWGGAAGCDAYVRDTQAYSTPHSLASIPTTDIVHTFDENTGEWEMTGWCYIPTGSTGNQYFIMLNTYILPSTFDWSVQIQFDSDAGNVIDTYSTSTESIIYDTWVEVKVEIYLDQNSYDVYYNDAFMASNAWQSTGVNEIAALDIFSSGGSTIFWDDLVLLQTAVAFEHSTWGNIKTIMQ